LLSGREVAKGKAAEAQQLGFALFAPNAPARLEDHGEDGGVDDEHEYRVEERQASPMTEPL